MGEVKQLTGKIFCILCNGVVAFKNGDKSRFVGHMNHEHEAFSGISFVLAGCLMSQEERVAVETIMEEKYKTGMIEVNRLEDESLDEIPVKLTETVHDKQEEVSSDVDIIETASSEVNENVPDVAKEAPEDKEELDSGTVSPKVKISMRSFLLENKNLLSKAKTEEHSTKKPEPVSDGELKELKTTERSAAQNGQFQCDLCTVNFKAISSLRRHKIKLHDVNNKAVTPSEQIPSTPTSKPVSTPKSSESKTVTVQLSSSTLIEASNSEFQNCKKCDAKFKLESNLDKHMKIAHPEPVVIKPIKQDPEKRDRTPTPPAIVPSPKLTVKTVEALNNSVGNLVDKSECTACETCGDLFRSEKLLSQHVINQHNQKEVLVKTEQGDDSPKVLVNGDMKTFKCDQCSKKFIMERNFHLHKSVAHGRTSGRKKSLHKVPKFNFTCSPCNIRFESKAHLENHEKASHKNEPTKEDVSSKVNLEKVSISKVSASPKSNPSKQSLKFMKRSIKKEPGELAQLPCRKCPVVFGNEIALKRHNIKRHGANILRCITCKKTFKTKREYRIHMKHVHPPDSKPGKYACDVCNISLQHSSSLRRHKEQQHGINQSQKEPTEEAKVKEASFVTEMKKKIVDDKEEKEKDSSIKSKECDSSDQKVNTSVTLEESSSLVDLSTCQYFLSHPSMVKPLTKKLHQKLLDKEMIIEDRNLPAGWFILNTLRKGRQGNKEFITPDRKVIRSVDGMREYMRVSNNYSRAEIQSVSKYFRRRMSI